MRKAECRTWVSDLVEFARVGLEPDAALGEHLRECPRCAERWEDQRRLTSRFQALQAAAREAGTARPSVEARRAMLLMRFEQTKRSRPLWGLKTALAAAAAVVLAVALGYLWRTSAGHVQVLRRTTAAVAVPLSGHGIETLSPDNGEFVAVPYAPPLAAGELVSVVRTELQATALARMGFEMDTAGLAGAAGPVQADVVMGDDGLPRAVRVIRDTTEF